MYLWLEECGLINGVEIKEEQKKDPDTDQSEPRISKATHICSFHAYCTAR